MEMYDYSALADGNFGSSMDGFGASGNSIGSDMGGTGGSTGGFGSGMGGGTNSFGSGMGGGTNSFGSGMGGGEGTSGNDLEQMFGESPWGGLKDVGFTSLEQVFRGNAGGNLQRGGNTSGGNTSGSGINNQGEGDPLLSGGEGNTSSNGYTYNFSSLS